MTIPGMAERIELMDPAELVPDPRNPKTHPPAQIARIAKSIRTAGFCAPVLTRGGMIVGGHGRTLAALLIGLDVVPVIPLDHLDDAQVAFYLAADNQLGAAEHAPYDPLLLAQLLAEIDTGDLEVEDAGFDPAEVEKMMAAIESAPESPEEESAAPHKAKRDRTATERKSAIHGLKCWPSFYEPLLDGTKTFELRRNDRGFSVGDRLQLREWDPATKEFTGRETWRRISYICSAADPLGLEALAPEFVILGLRPSRGD